MSFRTSAVGGPEEAAGGQQRGPCSLFGKGEDPARLAGERKRYMKAKLAHVVQRLSHVVCTTRGSAGSPRSSAFVPVRLFSGRPELSSLPRISEKQPRRGRRAGVRRRIVFHVENVERIEGSSKGWRANMSKTKGTWRQSWRGMLKRGKESWKAALNILAKCYSLCMRGYYSSRVANTGNMGIRSCWMNNRLIDRALLNRE